MTRSTPIPVKAITRMWIIRSVFALIVAGAGLGFGWYVYRDTQEKVDQVLTVVPTFTIPNVEADANAVVVATH